ncbi:MAG: MFS transporter [Candidatus Thorarchaeota archaeon]|nr:MFS transporter [Candidatus Thorarchaeota archaeon]
MVTPDHPVIKPAARRIGGLTGNLWRLALVIGVAQFSMSVWTWQFGIYIETLIEPWQMGLTFTASSIAGLVGVPLSGYVSDFIGRRKTLLIAYIPMAIGLFFLFSFPVWPFLPIFYGLIQFGWSFVVIMARAAPADQISQDKGKDAGRTFTTVLLPAFAIDGLSPLLASFLLVSGVPQRNLLILGGIGTIIAFIVSALFVRETLDQSIQEKARSGSIITLRGLGNDFWILAVGLVGLYMSFGLAFPYLGNLVVSEWSVSTSDWGIIWCLSSLTIAALSYFGGKLADKKLKTSMVLSVLSLSLIILGHGFLSGIYTLLFINVIWGVVIVFWVASERALIVQGVGEEKKGRALSTFQALMSTAQMLMMNVGAAIWTFFGSLRFLFIIAGIVALVSTIPLSLAMRYITIGDESTRCISNQESVE